MRVKLRALIASLAVSLANLMAGEAHAQPSSDPSLDQRIDRVTALFDPEAERAEAILTGRDDIVLLDRRKLFTATGALAGNYTDNAALSPTDRKGDSFLSADGIIRAQTRIASRIDVHAQASVSIARYDRERDLDYEALAGSIGAHTAWRNLDFDVAYTPVVVFEGGFEERQLTQHRVAASIGRSITLPRDGVLRGAVAAERIEADPSPYSNSAVSVNAIVGAPISRRRGIDGFVSIRGVARNYDDYFEGLVGDEREDRLVEGAAGIVWTPRPNVAVDLRWTQARNRSTSDVNRYRAGTGGLSLSARLRF